MTPPRHLHADGPTTMVGPFHVLDLDQAGVVARLTDLASSADRAVLAYALHVGGLNERQNAAFVAAMERGDAVYADGGSVVWLARRAGARLIERAPTTDIGWALFSALHARLGRKVRLVLVGGPPGLAERAGACFDEGGDTATLATFDGFQRDWSAIVESIAALAPDVVVVGMGAPREMLWCEEWRDALPATLVLTCGGWFGHVTGEETRAPRVLRRPGLEWIARVWQQPRRLGPRYVRGFASTARIALEQRRARAG